MNDQPNDGLQLVLLIAIGLAICAMAAASAFQPRKPTQRDDWRAECLSKGGTVVARTRLGPKAMPFTDYVCEVRP